MRREGKKLISLFLVISVLSLSGNMFAKERKGADLIIQKTDGQQVRGELIAVKQNSLLLLERESGADVTVDIEDVSEITHAGKSKVFQGFGAGLVVGSFLGATVGAVASKYVYGDGSEITIGSAVIGGLAGLIAGGYIGESAGKDVTIQIEGKSDSEIQEILEELRIKARVKNAQ